MQALVAASGPTKTQFWKIEKRENPAVARSRPQPPPPKGTRAGGGVSPVRNTGCRSDTLAEVPPPARAGGDEDAWGRRKGKPRGSASGSSVHPGLSATRHLQRAPASRGWPGLVLGARVSFAGRFIAGGAVDRFLPAVSGSGLEKAADRERIKILGLHPVFESCW